MWQLSLLSDKIPTHLKSGRNCACFTIRKNMRHGCTLRRVKLNKKQKSQLFHWSCWQRHPTNKIMEKDRGIYLWLLKLLRSDCWKIINFIHPQFRVSSISSVRSCLLNVCHFYKSLLRPAWNFLARYMRKTCCRAENKHEPLFWLTHANRNKIEGRKCL